MSSCYFLGFGLGLLLMFYPDLLGRKKTMVLLLVPYVIFTQLTIYSASLTGKKIGFFMQGLLHLKITLSYTHMFELTDEASKDFCATVINMTDSLTMFIIGFCLKYLVADAILIVQVANAVGIIAIILYIFLVPESPKWLILNQRFKEGVRTLNYISRLNGCS